MKTTFLPHIFLPFPLPAALALLVALLPNTMPGAPLIREVAAEKKLPRIDIHAAFEGKPDKAFGRLSSLMAGC